MKRYWFLSAFGCVVLAFAAVWLGGLNQDEGWYLYAAQMVADGKIPYRDFFYTQAPVMPIVYSAFAAVWNAFGLLGARVLTMAIGLLGILFSVALVRRFVPAEKRTAAEIAVFLLLGSNLYHLYYLAIPKTYALASLFVAMGFYLLSIALSGRRGLAASAGLSLAFAAGTRISLGILLAVVGFWLLFDFRKYRWSFLWFGLGGALGLAVVYGYFLFDPGTRDGLIAAQAYHAARGGFDPVFTVGSVSRLARWYLPVFIVLGLGGFKSARILLYAFLAVFAVQMLAPFPYEDYQVPVMSLLAVFAVANLFSDSNTQTPENPNTQTPKHPNTRNSRTLLLVLGLCFASSFGSPLLERWMTDGQDRFWTVKKEKCELAQLREVARAIEEEDPNGKELLTQDLYLAIETGRRVPEGLEMGPFSMLTDEQWRELLASAPCEMAALSGYSFAVNPPVCDEIPIETQIDYWSILKKNYDLVGSEERFGQNATSLLILKRKPQDNP